MNPRPVVKDLVVLTADKNAQFALQGLVSRFKSLRIRRPSAEYHVHPEKDPGVLREAHNFLRLFTQTHAHALVLMDREGSGREELSRVELEQQLENKLRTAGWDDRAAAIVTDPELEIWVWSDSPHVDGVLGWEKETLQLRTWLQRKGLWRQGADKPDRPKEALEAALRQVRQPRSSAIYKALAEKVSLSRCRDPAFGKLKDVLRKWFKQT